MVTLVSHIGNIYTTRLMDNARSLLLQDLDRSGAARRGMPLNQASGVRLGYNFILVVAGAARSSDPRRATCLKPKA